MMNLGCLAWNVQNETKGIINDKKMSPLQILFIFFSPEIYSLRCHLELRKEKNILFLKIYSFQLDSVLLNNSMRLVSRKGSRSESTLQLCNEWDALQSDHRIKGRQNEQEKEPVNE